MNTLYKISPLVLSFLVGCSSDNAKDKTSPEASFVGDEVYVSPLQDKKWQLVSYGLQVEPKTDVLAGSFYSLDFTDDTNLVGDFDCNSLHTTYAYNASSLAIGTVATTEMACPLSDDAKYQSQNDFILNALVSVESYDISGSLLTISASDSSQLIYSAIESSLQDNPWTLVAYGLISESKNDLLEHTSYTLDFTNSTHLEGSFDCNTFESEYSSSSLSLMIDAVSLTEIGCISSESRQSHMAQNDFILNALASAKSYEISSSQLIIYSSNRSQLIYNRDEK